MKRTRMSNIVNTGTDSMVDAVHLAAARSIMIQKPQIKDASEETNNRAFIISVGEFKEDYYFLNIDKLIAFVRTLSIINRDMFSNYNVSGPLSVLGTDRSLESVLDVAAAEMPIFKEACEFFDTCGGRQHVKARKMEPVT